MSDAPERIWAWEDPIAGIIGQIVPARNTAKYIRADIAAARIAELEAEVERLKDALAFAVGLGQDLGMTEMEIDAVYDRAALTAQQGQSADRPDLAEPLPSQQSGAHTAEKE